MKEENHMIEPKEECEKIMNTLLPIGVDFLKKHKEFYPFGAVMSIDGEISFIGFYDGNEMPDSKELLHNLKKSCKHMADNNEIKASGFAFNTSISSDNGKDEDAIIISLEHKERYSVQVALPYKAGFLGRFRFGDLIALKGENDIF